MRAKISSCREKGTNTWFVNLSKKIPLKIYVMREFSSNSWVKRDHNSPSLPSFQSSSTDWLPYSSWVFSQALLSVILEVPKALRKVPSAQRYLLMPTHLRFHNRVKSKVFKAGRLVFYQTSSHRLTSQNCLQTAAYGIHRNSIKETNLLYHIMNTISNDFWISSSENLHK